MPVSFLRRCLAAAVLVSVSMAALPGPAMAALGLDLVASSFTEPIFLTHAGDSRLFVVEQDGRIKIIGGGTFLDITGMTSKGGERGLLGLAFHPNYASPSLPGSGRFYVNYTRKSDGDTVIAEFKRSVTDPNKADPASKRIVMVINQPYPNHNGGWIGFKGNYLYIAMGDGGAGGDPGNRAQNLNSLLGKILRINPLDPDGGGPRKYSIPADNPFVGVAGKDQIWSYGLRNPWRCSFDREDGTLYCGDVGQGVYEEIDRAASGRAVNFGWRLLEGEHYYDWPGHSSGTVCTVDCKTLPVVEYSHSGVHCAVTGGYVSRRSGADLEGRYVFGDFCSGYVWTIAANAPVGTVGTLIENTSHSISSFGEGSDGKLYLVDLGGSIYRLTDS